MTTDLDHDEVMTLLPWHAARSLSGDESAAVRAHLQTCAECRQELQCCSALSGALSAAAGDAWQLPPQQWARLRAAVERPATRAGVASLLDRLLRRRGTTPPALRWALAGQGALVLALAAALFVQREREPAFETLSRPEAVAPRAGHASLHIAFADAASERDVRALLDEMQADIVRGPNSLGVYTIELRDGAAATTDPAALLVWLRADRRVVLAEFVAQDAAR